MKKEKKRERESWEVSFKSRQVRERGEKKENGLVSVEFVACSALVVKSKRTSIDSSRGKVRNIHQCFQLVRDFTSFVVGWRETRLMT